ncbi:MAG TPA: NADPH-dependent F420 reductase [Stellaceae bacterium]|nr:NADPH-dependent F420 reductase [Stellaceae bacterium]
MAQTLAILGGTGQQGGALALRWARAGYGIVIGSRDAARAQAKARELKQRAPGASIAGADLAAAAKAGDIVVLSVPYAAHRATLEAVKDAVQGKLVVDVTVPLVPPRVARVQLPPEGSAAAVAQAVLGDGVKVVSAFQNVAAHLLEGEGEVACDVLVCGDDKDARGVVVALAKAAGLRAFHGGALANSAASEALTSVLIFLNGRYRTTSGIRLTGLPDDPA